MFLRFLRLLIIIFSVFTLLTFTIIVPANAVHIESSLKGLERISWTKFARIYYLFEWILTLVSSITSPHNQSRFAIHIIIVYLLTGKRRVTSWPTATYEHLK